MTKIKQYALSTLARQKMGKYTVEDCIKFKEENGIFPFTGYENDEDEKWIYDFYVEYFKKIKSGLADNAFFTPSSYADKIKSIAVRYLLDYPDKEKFPVILDAFCGIGNLTLGYYDKVEAFDINTEFLEVCNYKNNQNNERLEKLFPLKYEVTQFNAFNFNYDTRKFSVNELGKTYNCIISNPPFGKYRGSVIDKAVIEFFEKHLNKDGILISILPNNFYDKYSKFLTGFELLQTGGEVRFDYTGMVAKIFVFKKL